MESMVVYDSKFGNTRKVAEAIAGRWRTRGSVRLLSLDTIVPDDLGQLDLLLIGGPTQAHGMSARVRQFTDALSAASRVGTVIAVFDTRLRLPRILSGSAAKTAATKLRQAGLNLAVPAVSFFVSGATPELEPGELARRRGLGGRDRRAGLPQLSGSLSVCPPLAAPQSVPWPSL